MTSRNSTDRWHFPLVRLSRLTRGSSLASTLLVSLLLTGCAQRPTAASSEAAEPWSEVQTTHLWVCSDSEVMQTRQAGRHLWLQLPNADSWLQLTQTRAASGSLYQHQNQHQRATRFWTQGERARVITPQKEWPYCRLEAQGKADDLAGHPAIVGADASPEALTLRATGHHPGWLLEVRQKGSGLLSFNYGTEEQALSTIEKTHQDLIERRYQAELSDGSTLNYRVENVMCIDIMSGEPFQHRVEIRFDGQVYKGCGQSF